MTDDKWFPSAHAGQCWSHPADGVAPVGSEGSAGFTVCNCGPRLGQRATRPFSQAARGAHWFLFLGLWTSLFTVCRSPGWARSCQAQERTWASLRKKKQLAAVEPTGTQESQSRVCVRWACRRLVGALWGPGGLRAG